MAPQGEPAILKQVLYDRDGMVSLLARALIRAKPRPPVDRAPLQPSNTGDQIPRHRIPLRHDTPHPALTGVTYREKEGERRAVIIATGDALRDEGLGRGGLKDKDILRARGDVAPDVAVLGLNAVINQ